MTLTLIFVIANEQLCKLKEKKIRIYEKCMTNGLTLTVNQATTEYART